MKKDDRRLTIQDNGVHMGKKYKIGHMVAVTLIIVILVGCNINNGIEETAAIVDVSYTGFGAVGTVEGSLHKLSIGSYHYLIDVGAFYGDAESNYPLPSELDVTAIDSVFITHAHTDHVGRIPLLLEMGYKGPIYMTSVTKDLTIINILSSLEYCNLGVEKFYYSRNNKNDKKPVYLDRFDYGQYEVKDKNRIYIQLKRNELEENGYYLHRSVIDHLQEEMRIKLEKQLIPVDYGETIKLSNDDTVEFIYTSHLPGSAMIYFTIGGKNILFSGDVGSDNSPFLRENTAFKYPVDFLFIEGTYGTNIRKYDTKAERQKFIEYIGEAIKNNERVIIPAFAIDRSQQVLYEIKTGIKQGTIPENTCVKVFSPTTEKIIDLYATYSENKGRYGVYFSDQMFTDIFNIKNLLINPTLPDSKMYDLNVEYGEIAIMTSGMITSGFSKELLKNYIKDTKTNFISVSYQDPDEIGGKVFRGDDIMHIDGIEYQVKAKTFSSSAFSGHADISKIQNIFGGTVPEQIMIVHLNDYDKDNLIDSYSEYFKSSIIIVPAIKEPYLLYQY